MRSELRAAPALVAAILTLPALGCLPDLRIEEGSLSVRVLGADQRAESVWVTLLRPGAPGVEREALGPAPLVVTFELIAPGLYGLHGEAYSAAPARLLQQVDQDNVEVLAGERTSVLLYLDRGDSLDAGVDDTSTDSASDSASPEDADTPG